MTYKRGDITLALYPDSNLVTAKPRPVLVVQANELRTGLPQLVVAMITSNLTRANHPCRVFIPLSGFPGNVSGLLTDSIIMTDNLRTILHTHLIRTLGKIPDMTLVDQALRITLQL